ncbi:MAG: ABC transporter ATP-binding protein [Andreesenia angusta]|nr:ABC transporter ATP-binding protein [Andreesenia angusta]
MKQKNDKRVQKAKDFKGTMKKIFSYMSEYKLKLILAFSFAILGTALSILGPNVLRKATNRLSEGIIAKAQGVNNAKIDFPYIHKILIIILILYILSMIFSSLQAFIFSDISQRVSYKLRKEISEKINRLPVKYFDINKQGDILSRITNDVDLVSQNLTQNLSQLISSIITIIGVFLLMLYINIKMTIIAVLILPLSVFIISFIIKKSQRYFSEQQRVLGKVNAEVQEQFSGQNIIKSFNKEANSIENFKELTDELYKSSWKSQFLSGTMNPIMNFVGNLGYVIVTISGGFFVMKNIINIGDILAFVQYIRTFTQPINQFAQIVNNLQSAAAAGERIFEFLEAEEEVVSSNKRIDIENIKGDVVFKDINFSYDGNNMTIKNLNLDIKAGEKIAIVGSTGSGKTTLIKLLARFYELNSGSIYIDGKNITEFSKYDLRRILGIVLQDTWLFNGSIMENIRFGKLDASDQDVIDAAKMANADNFIRTLPETYNMVINEEANNISEGQKQLITIARAIISKPKILILDESTSSIDTRTELLLQTAIDDMMIGRTSFIIAHRLSTVKNADKIIVLDNGEIVEAGTHNELLDLGGKYHDIYNSQFNR